jgi:hypothetical protein
MPSIAEQQVLDPAASRTLLASSRRFPTNHLLDNLGDRAIVLLSCAPINDALLQVAKISPTRPFEVRDYNSMYSSGLERTANLGKKRRDSLPIEMLKNV